MTKTTKFWSQTHKTPIKNAPRSAQNSTIFSGEAPKLPIERGNNPSSRAIPPLVPSTLDSFLSRTTFKYAATALRNNQINNYDDTLKENGLMTHRAKENIKLSYGGPSQRQASGTNQQIKALRQGRHNV